MTLEGADKLHAGLEFIVHTCATNEEEAKGKSKGFVEVILNLLSLSMLSSCDAANIINVIEIKMDTNLSPFQHYIYPFENDFISWFLVKIDATIFVEIWNKFDKNEHRQRLMRAMSWFRTGLNKKGLDSTSETAEFRTQFPATPPSSHNHLANIHRNHLESTHMAKRHATRQQNNRILPKFHRVSQKNPAHHRKLPLTTSSRSTQPFGQPNQTQILYQTQTPAQF